MQKTLKYTIFKTKWGYFGLAGLRRVSSSRTEYALWRSCLPLSEPEEVKSHLLKNLSLLNRGSSTTCLVSTQMSLRAKRSNLDAGKYEIAAACKADLAMTYDHQVIRIEFDRNLFRQLQEQIIAYFEGVCVNFSRDIPIVLDGFSSFDSSVLTACRDIKFGQRISYSALAKKLGRPNTSRAVGNALAKNPLPLIIPCHRVVRSDGTIGGFSAPGGKGLKAKLLKLEQCIKTSVKYGIKY